MLCFVASNIDERTLKKDGVCAASLPTTMGIVAGFLVQNSLKYLLGFGEVTHYLGYNALKDFFPTMSMKPNPQCDDNHCRLQQREYQEQLSQQPAAAASMPHEKAAIVHADNDWGIELVSETTDDDLQNMTERAIPDLVQGVEPAYTLPASSHLAPCDLVSDEISLEELMQRNKLL
jgi:ubiquitin-like modifier-activating enzyme 5